MCDRILKKKEKKEKKRKRKTRGGGNIEKSKYQRFLSNYKKFHRFIYVAIVNERIFAATQGTGGYIRKTGVLAKSELIS